MLKGRRRGVQGAMLKGHRRGVQGAMLKGHRRAVEGPVGAVDFAFLPPSTSRAILR